MERGVRFPDRQLPVLLNFPLSFLPVVCGSKSHIAECLGWEKRNRSCGVKTAKPLLLNGFEGCEVGELVAGSYLPRSFRYRSNRPGAEKIVVSYRLSYRTPKQTTPRSGL